MNNLNPTHLHIIINSLWLIDPDRLEAEEAEEAEEEKASSGICAKFLGLVSTYPVLSDNPDATRAEARKLWFAEKDAIIRRWTHFSGCTVHPVPSNRGREHCSQAAYYRHAWARTLWCGRQGELRRDLLDHLIAGFERLLSQAQQEAL